MKDRSVMRVNNCEIKSETNKQTAGTSCHSVDFTRSFSISRQSLPRYIYQTTMISTLQVSINSAVIDSISLPRSRDSCDKTCQVVIKIKIVIFIYGKKKGFSPAQDVRPWGRCIVRGEVWHDSSTRRLSEISRVIPHGQTP